MTDVATPWQPGKIFSPAVVVRDLFAGSRLLGVTAAVFAVGFVVCSSLPLVDGRVLLGVSVWEKPAKFFLSGTAPGDHCVVSCLAVSSNTKCAGYAVGCLDDDHRSGAGADLYRGTGVAR